MKRNIIVLILESGVRQQAHMLHDRRCWPNSGSCIRVLKRAGKEGQTVLSQKMKNAKHSLIVGTAVATAGIAVAFVPPLVVLI